jgi:hypothetical protein
MASCPLGRECPLANQNPPCPLGENCHKFPVGRLMGLLNDLDRSLGASINSFRDNEDLINALNRLRIDISLVLSKLS